MAAWRLAAVEFTPSSSTRTLFKCGRFWEFARIDTPYRQHGVQIPLAFPTESSKRSDGHSSDMLRSREIPILFLSAIDFGNELLVSCRV